MITGPLSNYTLLVVILIVAIVVGFFLIKNLMKLVINSVLGLLLLFFVNYFHVLGAVGKPDVPLTPLTFLICLFGGIPGALILIMLQLLNFPL
ncbi:MAG: pro-sigmaK processing inhibitor BofA family protein [Methanomicrobiales archaeon]